MNKYLHNYELREILQSQVSSRRMVKWLRILSPKDQSLDPCTHIRQLTTVNSSSKGSDFLSAFLSRQKLTHILSNRIDGIHSEK